MKLGWFVLEVLLVGMFFYLGSKAAFAFAIIMIAIPLCSVMGNLYVRNRIRTSIAVQPNLRKGNSGEFVLTFENPTLIPVFHLQCKVRVENQLNREWQMLKVQTWLPAKKEQKIVLQAGSNYCGRLKIWMDKVSVCDCFGLIGINCKPEESAYMTVQPDTYETVVMMTTNVNHMDDSEVYSQERPGSDLTETYQIREYVPGDSPRQIHWKLSGKFDRLIVKDPALPIIRNVLVFWERTGESDDYEMIDAQAEIIVSLCKALLEQSIQFTVGWNDTDRNLCILHEISNTEELVGIIPKLMRATGKKEGYSGADLLLQTGGYALCGHMIYLAQEPQCGVEEWKRYGNVTVLSGSDTASTGTLIFDSANYKEQLSQIEL